MFRALILTFIALIAISEAQYWNRQSHWARPQPVHAYGRYGSLGGSYVAPPAPRAALPQYVAQPQYAGRYAEDESYKPFSFGYSNVDEYGTQLGRQEVADGSGGVRGSYAYRDPSGQYRQVDYVADGAGFRAVVNTNEAGVVPHKPADVVYNVH